MAGYIGSKAAVVSSGVERKKTYAITTSTTSLTGLNYTVGKVHVFQNGVRLLDGTDYTATNGTSITLTVAAQSGDNVVVVSQASFQLSEHYTSAEADAEFVTKTGDTMSGGLTVQGTVAATAVTGDGSGLTGLPAGVGGANGVIFNDNVKAQFGAGSDLQIYHNGGSGNFIDSVNKDLYIRCNLDAGITGGDIAIQPKAGENSAVFRDNAGAELYYDNSKKIETTSTGVDVTGTVTGSTGITTGVNYGNFTPVTSGTTGARISANGNGMLRLASGGVDKMYVLDSGNVGIGVSSPNATLTVSQSGNNIFAVERTGVSSGSGQFGINIETSSQTTVSYDDGAQLVFGTASSPSTHTGFTERMKLDSSGRVTKPNQPYFNVQKSSSQNNITAGSYTTVTFGTEHVDTGGNFANNTFTAPVTGVYSLSIGVRLDNFDPNATYYNFWLQTSNRAYHQLTDLKPSSRVMYIFAMNVIADMDANDTAVFQIQQQGGTSQTDINPSTFFQGYLLG
ncbi:hypothetical protein OAH93_01655 [Flavobacteriales bacterium]|nr:hypothetical protein [Flavobacteriales bacterium]